MFKDLRDDTTAKQAPPNTTVHDVIALYGDVAEPVESLPAHTYLLQGAVMKRRSWGRTDGDVVAQASVDAEQRLWADGYVPLWLSHPSEDTTLSEVLLTK